MFQHLYMIPHVMTQAADILIQLFHFPDMLFHVTDPVSYTHLDVYKRQVLFSAATFDTTKSSSLGTPHVRTPSPTPRSEAYCQVCMSLQITKQTDLLK